MTLPTTTAQLKQVLDSISTGAIEVEEATLILAYQASRIADALEGLLGKGFHIDEVVGGQKRPL